MLRIIATKEDFLSWGFSLHDCPEFSDVPNDAELIYYSDGYWYLLNDANDPLSDPGEFCTPETWLTHVSVPEKRIEKF